MLMTAEATAVSPAWARGLAYEMNALWVSYADHTLREQISR